MSIPYNPLDQRNFQDVVHGSPLVGFTGPIPITLRDDRVCKTETEFFPLFTTGAGGTGGGSPGPIGPTGPAGATGPIGPTGPAGAGSTGSFFWGVRTSTLSVLQGSNTQIPFVQQNASAGDWTVVGGNTLRYDGATTKTFAIEALACLQYSGMSMVDGTFYLQIRRNGTPFAVGSGVVNVVNIGSPVETVMARSVSIMNTNDTLTFFATVNGSDANMLDVSFSAGGTTYSSEPCTILVQQIS